MERLVELADGFSSFSTTTKRVNEQVPTETTSAENRLAQPDKTESVIELAKDSADILLASNGNLLQSLLLEEGALAASARTKDLMKSAFVDTPALVRQSLPFGDLLPRLPFEQQVEPFVEKSQTEQRAQLLAEKLLAASQVGEASSPPQPGSALDAIRSLDPEQTALVLRELRENLPKYAPLIQQLSLIHI